MALNKLASGGFVLNDYMSVQDCYMLFGDPYSGTYERTGNTAGGSGLPMYSNGNYILAIDKYNVFHIYQQERLYEVMNDNWGNDLDHTAEPAESPAIPGNFINNVDLFVSSPSLMLTHAVYLSTDSEKYNDPNVQTFFEMCKDALEDKGFLARSSSSSTSSSSYVIRRRYNYRCNETVDIYTFDKNDPEKVEDIETISQDVYLVDDDYPFFTSSMWYVPKITSYKYIDSEERPYNNNSAGSDNKHMPYPFNMPYLSSGTYRIRVCYYPARSSRLLTVHSYSSTEHRWSYDVMSNIWCKYFVTNGNTTRSTYEVDNIGQVIEQEGQDMINSLLASDDLPGYRQDIRAIIKNFSTPNSKLPNYFKLSTLNFFLIKRSAY